MPNVIYCYSGTGNSLAAARLLGGRLPVTEIISLLALRSDSSVPAKYERVGFCFPTCFGHPPKIVAQIGQSLHLHPHQKPFIMASCGGYNILTIADFRKILQTKTQNPIQCFQVILPGSHIIGFSAFPKPIQRWLFRRTERLAGRIACKIRNDKPTREKRVLKLENATTMSRTFNGWLGIKDIFSTRTEYFTTDNCIRCGTCGRLCPVGNISVGPEKVTFGHNCQQCMACIQWCPRRAIAHPNVPAKRKRYRHPDVTVEDMIQLAAGGPDPLNRPAK
ncbi:MAG: 4Fe-4S dicluster domain-containing protein [Alistipes sp.]|nr:4Fe-4S dicluster domain-containing protein [Alistipes sp.]